MFSILKWSYRVLGIAVKTRGVESTGTSGNRFYFHPVESVTSCFFPGIRQKEKKRVRWKGYSSWQHCPFLRLLLAAAGGLVLHMAPCTGRAEVIMALYMKLVLTRQMLW
jgi:hypothetical protein